MGLVVLAVVAGGLFLQRYGTNMLTYHTPVPACDVVLSETDCMAYGPWARNYLLAQSKAPTVASPSAYTWTWLQALHYRLFFTVNGPADDFRNYPPLPLPAAAAAVIAVTGTVALLLYGRKVFAGQPLLGLFLLIVLLYCGVLWAEDFSQFVQTGQPVAINGRYMLPIVLLLAAVFGRALSVAVARKQAIKTMAAAVVILLFLQGGGVFSFILRSDDWWYWPNNAIVHMNNGAQRMLAPVIIEGSKYY
jgi:hypothetical protein